MKQEIFTREELHKLVWSEPMSSIAKKYEISDNGLRKICRRMNIPFPQFGYWQKIRHGKKELIKKLPKDYPGENRIKLIIRDPENPKSSSKSLLKKLITEIENNSQLPTQVPQNLTNPDKLIIAAKESLIKDKKRHGRFREMVTTRFSQLNIRVAPENAQRALRFMNTFIKLLRARNHDIIVKYEKTYAIIIKEEIEISLKEKMKIVEVPDHWDSRQYHPTGILAFRIEEIYSKEWKDGKQPLESRLAEILVTLELRAKREKEERIEREKHWQKIEEENRKREELEKRKQKELEEFQNLIKESTRWNQAKILREYLNEFEVTARKNGNLTKELQEWIIWAKQKADWYDPLGEKEDDIINGNDSGLDTGLCSYTSNHQFHLPVPCNTTTSN